MAPAVLAYWDIRGLAQPIRLLLEYVGMEWEDKYYVCGPAPTFDKSCWFDVKPSLGIDFPNLPYFIDGKVKIAQSNAIMRYLARKFGLDGETEEEKIRIDVANGVLEDFRNGFVGLCYNPNHDELKGPYLASLPDKLKGFSDFLGDRKFFAGENISFVDFLLYEMFDQHKLFSSDCLKAYPNLEAFQTRFEGIPPIANYMVSPKFIKTPLNNRMARFGN